MADDRNGEGRSERGERNFFDRAGEELRALFGESDWGIGRGGWDREPNRSSYGGRPGGQGDFGGAQYRPASGHGSDEGSRSGPSSTGRPQSGTSHFDENYRRWRDEQIARMDREYEEYCREKQQHFENDFHSWRSSRATQQGASTGAAAPDGGSALFSAEPAAATTTGAGEASATRSSTGSSPDVPKE
jgi:hypothetical protein